MEAPEKIYVHEASAPELTEKLPYHIEYTRTDAFIEKACEWLDENCTKYWGTESVDNGMMLVDFKNYMKGE